MDKLKSFSTSMTFGHALFHGFTLGLGAWLITMAISNGVWVGAVIVAAVVGTLNIGYALDNAGRGGYSSIAHKDD